MNPRSLETESIFRNKNVLAGTASAFMIGALVLAATTERSNKAKPLECAAKGYPAQWQSGSELSPTQARTFATLMGVAVRDINAGSYGPAWCSEALKDDEAIQFISLEGVSDLCITMGDYHQVDDSPFKDKKYPAFVLCAMHDAEDEIT